MPPPADRFWLLTGEVPAGPFAVPEVHAELAAGRATWQTPACAVGGNVWLPLARTPGVGPAAAPPVPTPDIPDAPPPAPTASRTRGAGGSVVAVGGLVVVVATLGYGFYEWVRPLTPGEVCRKLGEAATAAEARRYATPRLQPVLDALFADTAADPNDTFGWTQEVDGPRPRTRLVGFRGDWFDPAAGRRVRVEGHVLVVQDGGWKADDVVFTGVEGASLPGPVSLVDEYRRNPPAPGGGPGAAQPTRPAPVGLWAFVERNWKGMAALAVGYLMTAGNPFRSRPGRRPAGTGGVA